MAGQKRATNTTTNVSQFGRGYIRPTRTEAEEDPGKFYELVTYAREKKRLTGKNLAETLGIDEANVSRRLNGKTLGEDERLLVIAAMFDDLKTLSDPSGRDIRAIRDNLYFSLVDFFRVMPTSQDNARGACVGTYQLWRHSVEGSGEYVRGRLDFEEDELSGALKVRMKQVRKRRDRMRGSVEEFTGYLIRNANSYAMLLRDIATNDMRLTIFPHPRIEYIGADIDPKSTFPGRRKHVVHMDGFGMGIDSKKLFLSPVYIELVDDRDELAALDEQLDVVPESEAPRRVVAKLQRHALVVK